MKLQEMLDDERIAGWIQKWERVKIERVAALKALGVVPPVSGDD